MISPSSGGAVAKDGAFRFEDVPPGRYTLRATVETPSVGGRPPEKEITGLKMELTVPEVPVEKPNEAVDLGRTTVKMLEAPAK